MIDVQTLVFFMFVTVPLAGAAGFFCGVAFGNTRGLRREEKAAAANSVVRKFLAQSASDARAAHNDEGVMLAPYAGFRSMVSTGPAFDPLCVTHMFVILDNDANYKTRPWAVYLSESDADRALRHRPKSAEMHRVPFVPGAMPRVLGTVGR